MILTPKKENTHTLKNIKLRGGVPPTASSYVTRSESMQEVHLSAR